MLSVLDLERQDVADKGEGMITYGDTQQLGYIDQEALRRQHKLGVDEGWIHPDEYYCRACGRLYVRSGLGPGEGYRCNHHPQCPERGM